MSAKATVDELFYWGSVALLSYVAVNFLRDVSAVLEGGDVAFSPDEPDQNPIAGAIDILVPMQISPAGQAFIKQAEGLTLTRTTDVGHPSIGYGHTIQDGDDIGDSINQAQADALFQNDIAAAGSAVNNAITVQVSQNQFDAMGSLAFNIGATAFANSTLVKDLNAGDFAGAAAQFSQWDMSGGQINQDLVERRAGETNMFNGAS